MRTGKGEMIKIRCDICGTLLNTLGALIFSPPSKGNIVRKFHICSTCYYQKLFFKLLVKKTTPAKLFKKEDVR